MQLRICKDIHSGKKNGKKLEQHIRWCDLFCPESAFSTEQNALDSEEFLRSLKLLSPAEQAKELNVNLTRGNDGQRLFSNAMILSALRNGKQICYLERFNDIDHQNLIKQVVSENIHDDIIKESIMRNNLPVFCHSYRRVIRVLTYSTRLRDQEMARNLFDLESSEGSSNLKVCMQVGSAHSPELFLGDKIDWVVEELGPKRFSECRKRILESKASVDVVRELLYQYSFGQAFGGVNEHLIDEMTTPQLWDYIRSTVN